MNLEILMIVGFCLAAYSIVANDVPQTLGTFISSNSKRPWWILWLYTSAILVAVLFYGWYTSGTGDASYSRLESIPFPADGISLLYVIPPILILILTHYGIPVSTTFLVLTIFAPGNLGAMFTKSVVGYGIAFFTALIVYRYVFKTLSKHFNETRHLPPTKKWIVLQWLATAFLWSQWLIQDLANIFVYFPRQVSLEMMYFAVFVFVTLLGYIFYKRGGSIQHIVNTKTGVTDIRSATIIDFIYAFILLIFKEWSNMPMSTTWVFLGLLAGRELAYSLHLHNVDKKVTSLTISKDGAKLLIGLTISVLLATALPWLYSHIDRFF